LSSVVNITGAEGALDGLTINALGGNDKIDASRLPAGLIGLTLNGGNGDDQIIGSQGNDLVNGGTGADTALLGAGDDTFVWNPGDGSDVIEGQAGFDTLLFNGANVNEQINMSASGSRLRFTRDVANITMDVNDVEGVNFVARGGADTITVGDLTGTDVTQVNIDLAGTPGTNMGDGQADNVIVNATAAAEVVNVSGDASGVLVSGLFSTVRITGAEAANDVMSVNLLAGDDVLSASGLSANAIGLSSNGGDGDDVLIGGAGNDTFQGGAGDDVLIGGPGQDVLDGGTGDNVIIQ
jgi:Ca2+-binding RTX toxin-like protein